MHQDLHHGLLRERVQAAFRRTDSMNRFRYVILGGGMVAGYAAREFVERGVQKDELAIVSAENEPPYKRPPLTKDFLADPEATADGLLINSKEFYEENGIRLLTNRRIEEVDFFNRRLLGRDRRQVIEYENLIIATGCHVRELDCHGYDLKGVYYIRSVEDSSRLRSRLEEVENAVVVGGGFIALEVAATLVQKGLEPTVVFRGGRVLRHVFSDDVAGFIERYFSERGVRFKRNDSVASLGGLGRVREAKLETGEILPADAVVVGIGVQPAVRLFDGSRLSVGDGILVNEYLESNLEGVFAAGDVARYRDQLFDSTRRVEHWDNAEAQGQYVARRMTGLREPFLRVPHFFSDMFDLSFEFWGDPSAADHKVVRGSIEEGRFSAWWLKRSRVVAAFILNRPEEEREWAQKLIARQQEVAVDLLQDASRPLSAMRSSGSDYHEDVDSKPV